MIMRVEDHRLVELHGQPVAFRPTPNQSGPITPEYLIMHYTAGASAESSVSWLCNEDARASAHLVIGRDGSVVQLVDFDKKAWHAGASRWGNRRGLNGWSIGIEFDNCGELTRHSNGWRTAWGRRVNAVDVVEAPHKHGGSVRGWQSYTTQQLEHATEIAARLVSLYHLKDVLGHDDIAPKRKVDPGPAFPLRSIRSAALGRADPEDSEAAERFEDARTTAALNIRMGPGTQHEKLPASPLPEGTGVKILDTQGAWRYVEVLEPVQGHADVEGWVHGRFLREGMM